MTPHKGNGNCWHEPWNCGDCGWDEVCDVCHAHDEPRGDCEKCSKCHACEIEGREAGNAAEALF